MYVHHKIRIWDRIARKTPKRRFSDITFEFRIRFCYWRGNICITELLYGTFWKVLHCPSKGSRIQEKNTYTKKKIQWSWMYFKGSSMRWFLAYSVLSSFLVWIESVPRPLCFVLYSNGCPSLNWCIVFGTDTDRNRVTWETPSSEAIPFRRKLYRRVRLRASYSTRRKQFDV